MSDPLQEQLLGHLLGALEDSEEGQVAARLKSDAGLRRELARVRGRLEVLESGRYDFLPPPGLAERTCRVVASQAGSSAAFQRRPMSPTATAPSSAGRFRWLDVAVAAAVFAAVWLLTVPAIQSSRFNARLVACQGNLRQVGVGMLEYSQLHGGYFPCVSRRDGPGAAGICAPILARDGFVTESRWFVCPGSALADQQGFRASFRRLQTAPREKLGDLRRWMDESYAYHLGYIRDGVCHGTKNLGRTHFALGSDTPGSDPSNGRQSRNHGGYGQNVLLECGAVKFVTSSRPFSRADDIFANRWGLVAPGVDIDDSVIARPIGLLLATEWAAGGR